MTSAKHLAETGNMHHLKLHFSNPKRPSSSPSTWRWAAAGPGRNSSSPIS